MTADSPTDLVDRIQREWARAYPDLDVSPVGILGEQLTQISPADLLVMPGQCLPCRCGGDVGRAHEKNPSAVDLTEGK